ncbi:MAG: nucleoside deaminase [Clostridiales bacterium]|nr:nucleoside deaminase [Clostridia bacterium]MCR4883399.1 nucleoside deaminase [Clostridiales bacterium]
MTDLEGMSLALKEASIAAALGETPVGAVLVQGDQVIASAHNLRESLQDPTAHAEILCLQQAGRVLGTWRMEECTLYVTLEPCPMCAGAILMSRLARCVYGAYDPEKGCCGSVYDLPADPKFHAPTRWTAEIHKKECEQMLKDFFQHRRTQSNGEM